MRCKLSRQARRSLSSRALVVVKLRGRDHHYRPTPEHEGVPLVPTYHPAALLRNPGWVRAVWDDLQRVRSVLDA